ncbi:B3 domain-containing transcription factor VRN1-like [Tripterygium wilfordii]|uniref:B3 domain-containing transcription factor VRN1-like n=1 Tax=Tripterygium wilfordii TaxID=458696 RepID=A0A7J7DI30_TRIWF|nr:B3 domain-containing protein At1g49475-like [Tripterygium wilfordii]KAF5745716.1 B3 domain-containing transcription factor VRN1-like [Tripterygium wilfordii]
MLYTSSCTFIAIMPRQWEFGSGSGGRQQSKFSKGKTFQFFQIILEDSIQEKKLKLPLKFTQKFGVELSEFAILTVADGAVWQVGLTKSSSRICFDEGWDEFTVHYSLSHGHFIVFAYEGDSAFNVHIFDKSACEIVYPHVDLVEVDFPADKEDEDDPPTPITHRQYRSRQSNVSEGSRRALDAAKAMKPKNPSFMIVMKPCDLHRKALHVPALFARYHLNGKPTNMTVVASTGREWTLNVRETKDGALLFSGGCSQFIADNKLKNGDICVFEQITKDVSLEVTVFRASPE